MTSGRATTAPALRRAANGSHASIGSSEILTGRLDGMNERGLVIGLHMVRMSPRLPGLSCVLIVGIVLDQCASTAEAVADAPPMPHAMQYNYSLLDADGVAAVVEAVPGSVAVRTGCVARLHQPFPIAAVAAFESPGRAFARPVAAARGMGGAGAGRRSDVHGVEQTPPRRRFTTAICAALARCTRIVAEPAKRRLLIGIGGDAAALDEDMLDVDDLARGEDLPIAGLEGQLGGLSQPFEWPVRRARKAAEMA